MAGVSLTVPIGKMAADRMVYGGQCWRESLESQESRIKREKEA
jgi:hypothetical protein